MSWVDLAALTVMLWSAVKGYLLGIRQMVVQLCSLIIALLAALFLQKPFSLYLSLESQVDAFFIMLASRSMEELLNVGATGSPGLRLPPLAGAVMQHLAEEPEALAVFNQAAAPQVVGEMIVRLFAVVFFFCVVALTIFMFLKIRRQQFKNKNIPEWQRFLGLLVGLAQGLLLALFFCVLLDALSIFTVNDFLGQDLIGSYLYLVTAYFLAFI